MDYFDIYPMNTTTRREYVFIGAEKSLKIPKGGNQDPYIEDEQTSQWPKQKGQTTIYKTYI